MITDSQKGKWKNADEKMKTEEIEKKKEEKLGISISNHKIRLLKFLRFIAFTILRAFKNFIIRPENLVLCHNIEKVANLWHLWESTYGGEIDNVQKQSSGSFL